LAGAGGVEAILVDDFSGEVGHFCVDFVPVFLGEVEGAFELVALFFDAPEGVVVVDLELIESGGKGGHCVADEGDVSPGFEGEFDVVAAPVVLDDGSHVEIVGEDKAFVAKLVAQEAGENGAAKGGRHVGIELREIKVASHDGVELWHEGGVRKEVFLEEFGTGDVGDGEVVVGIAQGESIGGEVFATGENFLLSHPAIKDPGVIDDGLGIATPAATTESVDLIGEVVEIEDRREVEVNAEDFEELAGEGSKLSDLVRCPFCGEGGGVRRGGTECVGAPDATAFLVDGDEGSIEGEIGEGVGQFADLGGRVEITRKEDVASRLQVAEEVGFASGELRSGEANDETGGIHEDCSREAAMSPEKRGWGWLGLDLNSGWNCAPMKKG